LDTHTLEYVLNQLKEKPDEDRIKYLVTRTSWSRAHTEFQRYLSGLVPATHLVSLPEGDGDMEDIKSIMSKMGKLRVARDDIILRKMDCNRCHRNCETLFIDGKIKELHTGYALGDDGLWTQHSWGVDSNNKIIETTKPRIIYLTSFSWSD